MTMNLPISPLPLPPSPAGERPQFRDPRVMRVVLDEVWKAVTDQHLPLDREYLISMLLVRDARTRSRIDALTTPVQRAN